MNLGRKVKINIELVTADGDVSYVSLLFSNVAGNKLSKKTSRFKVGT